VPLGGSIIKLLSAGDDKLMAGWHGSKLRRSGRWSSISTCSRFSFDAVHQLESGVHIMLVIGWQQHPVLLRSCPAWPGKQHM
jgi:hypothetical protein